MDRKTLSNLFRIDLHTVRTHLEGITHEESLVPPETGGNPLNWVLGHLVAARDGLLLTLGRDPVLSDAERAVYDRGTTADPATALPLDLLRKPFVAAQRGIEKGLAEISDDALAQPIPEGESFPPGFETVFDKLAFLQFHEATTLGQIGLLRRLTGREGKIR